ncbi:SDR family oxidoreductase [Leptolyngbya sp. 7M]|uniref:SDR family oxidoreductase n=1 Tax=Leptolyngbya sp. 7M TaxID=2812896 RepID=UPI001B8DAA2B|nr:SDR family oxidoreductase [Leptolyngbya sp. 7M]QYO65878.1 SDR family oxidoreductase [Leptolyngbya sp. 7M]
MGKCLLLLGANSDIGSAIARKFASEGFDVILAGRRSERFDSLASDLSIRHNVKTFVVEFDASKYETHQRFFSDLQMRPEVVVYSIGHLGDQVKARTDPELALDIMTSNYTGAVSILSLFANEFEQRKSGSIIGISSVAGDRGRQSNYIYGSAKAGFTAFLSGLRHRLFPSGVNVITVKPGFICTKMTEGMQLPTPLTSTPDKLAEAVFSAYKRRKDIVYHLPMWRSIMFIIKMLPESLFVRTKL